MYGWSDEKETDSCRVYGVRNQSIICCRCPVISICPRTRWTSSRTTTTLPTRFTRSASAPRSRRSAAKISSKFILSLVSQNNTCVGLIGLSSRVLCYFKKSKDEPDIKFGNRPDIHTSVSKSELIFNRISGLISCTILILAQYCLLHLLHPQKNCFIRLSWTLLWHLWRVQTYKHTYIHHGWLRQWTVSSP